MAVRATQRLEPGQIFNQPQMSRGKPGVQMRILELVCDPAKQGRLRSHKEIGLIRNQTFFEKLEDGPASHAGLHTKQRYSDKM